MKSFFSICLFLAAGAVFAQTPNPTSNSEVADLLNNPPPKTTTLDGVVLTNASGDNIRLSPKPGSGSATYAFVTAIPFMNYVGGQAEVRTTDKRPVLHLKIGVNPTGRVYLAKMDSNLKENSRSLRLARSGGIIVPHAKWNIEYDVSEESPGIWKMTLKSDLPSGEYGIFLPANIASLLGGSSQDQTSGNIFDFGVDK